MKNIFLLISIFFSTNCFCQINTVHMTVKKSTENDTEKSPHLKNDTLKFTEVKKALPLTKPSLKGKVSQITAASVNYTASMNAKVSLLINDTLFSTTSDSLGIYSINNLKEGIYTIEVSCPNCITLQIPGIIIKKNKVTYLDPKLACLNYINTLQRKDRNRLMKELPK